MEMIQVNTRNRIAMNNNFQEAHLPGISFPNGIPGQNSLHFDKTVEFGPPLAKRRFLADEQPEFLNGGLTSDRHLPIFKGYFAGNPPPMLGRVDAR